MAIKLQRKILVNERYKMFLTLASAYFNLNLSSKEIEILDEFYWVNNGVLDSQARKSVRSKLKISEYNLNNQISKLRRKGILSKTSGDESIIPKLIPDIESENTNFVIGFYMQA